MPNRLHASVFYRGATLHSPANPVTAQAAHYNDGGGGWSSLVATGCELGQVRKEAAVATRSGAGIGPVGAVSNRPLLYFRTDYR